MNEEDKLYFPENVSKDYQVFEGLGGKEFKRYILPAIPIVIGIAVLPPYASVIFWIVKIFLILVIVLILMFLVGYTPYYGRKNVTAEMLIKQRINYHKRQKKFFIEKKDKQIHGK